MRLVRRPERGYLATPTSMATSFNDEPMRMEYMHGLAIQASWTGTSPVGVLKLQASNHAFDQNVNNGILADAIWTDIPGSSLSISSNTGDHMYDISEVYYEAIRVVYTATSGVGSISLYYCGKSDAA